MVFKKMLRKFGVGGPAVDTVLDDPRCRPGEPLSGEVRLAGGEADAEIEHIAVSLVARVGRGGGSSVEFHRVVVAGATRLAAKQQRTIPFTVPLPWEAPLTEVSGRRLPGVELGLRTELAIAKAVDKGDLDPVFVAPLPSQDAVLDGFGQLGFHFKSAELEAGQVYGVRQELPFVQEFEFYPPAQYAGRVSEVELILVTGAGGVDVIVEADKRGGAFGGGGGAAGRFHAAHDDAVDTDWAARITEWLNQVVESRQAYLAQPGYGHPGDHGHHHERRGPGMGGVVAGAAAGVVGGMILGEMLDDAFEGDDEG